MSKPHATIFDVDEHDFQQRVIEASSEQLILVDFWADWCSPCLVLAPVLERVLAEYEADEVVLAKVEADENMKLAGHYKLRGFPTVIAFRNGEELGRFSGTHPAHKLREHIDEWLAQSA